MHWHDCEKARRRDNTHACTALIDTEYKNTLKCSIGGTAICTEVIRWCQLCQVQHPMVCAPMFWQWSKSNECSISMTRPRVALPPQLTSSPKGSTHSHEAWQSTGLPGTEPVWLSPPWEVQVPAVLLTTASRYYWQAGSERRSPMCRAQMTGCLRWTWKWQVIARGVSHDALGAGDGSGAYVRASHAAGRRGHNNGLLGSGHRCWIRGAPAPGCYRADSGTRSSSHPPHLPQSLHRWHCNTWWQQHLQALPQGALVVVAGWQPSRGTARAACLAETLPRALRGQPACARQPGEVPRAGICAPEPGFPAGCP